MFLIEITLISIFHSTLYPIVNIMLELLFIQRGVDRLYRNNCRVFYFVFLKFFFTVF